MRGITLPSHKVYLSVIKYFKCIKGTINLGGYMSIFFLVQGTTHYFFYTGRVGKQVLVITN